MREDEGTCACIFLGPRPSPLFTINPCNFELMMPLPSTYRKWRTVRVVLLICLTGIFFWFGLERMAASYGINTAIDQANAAFLEPATPLEEQIAHTGALRLFTPFKWVYTILFSLLFGTLSVLGMYLFSLSQRWAIITAGIYLALTGMAFVLLIGGKLTGFPVQGYQLAHRVMELVQSPFMLMLLIPLQMITKDKV